MTVAPSLLAANVFMGLPMGWVLAAASFAFFAAVTYMMGLAVVQLATGRYRLDLEAHVMCTGVGLAVFAVLTVLLEKFGVNLTWWSFLLSACGLFVLVALRDIVSKRVPKTASVRPRLWTREAWFLLAAVGLAAVMFTVFLNGAFMSRWLIDDDSWLHAVSAKHVAVMQTYTLPLDVRNANPSYLEPYPSSYPVLMGVLNQIEPSIFVTLKFFNVLIVSLGIVYFYVMIRQWTGSPVRALWTTGLVWIMPCFMSHFIWSQSMALVMFFPGFWALERSWREPRWTIVAGVVTAGICLTQPSAAAVFLLMALIYWVVNVVFARSGKGGGVTMRVAVMQGIACAAGALFSLVYYLPALWRFGYEDFVRGITRSNPEVLTMKVSGVGRGLDYGLWDFIWSPAVSNKINQPTGLGPVLFALVLTGLVLLIVRWRRTLARRWQVTITAWLLFTVLGVVAEYLPVSLFPHRFWVFMAIPAAMVGAEFMVFVATRVKGTHVLLAAGIGAAVGLSTALSGLGEALFGLGRVSLSGARLWALVLAGGVSLAGIIAGICVLVKASAGSKTWGRFGGIVAIVAGVVLTSGFTKARFQGFTAWDPGKYFYMTRVVVQDGTTVETPPGVLIVVKSGTVLAVKEGQFRPLRRNLGELQEHSFELYGYAALRRFMLEGPGPNVPVLGLTCSDERIIGFDMMTPPFDRSIQALRQSVKDDVAHLVQLDRSSADAEHIKSSEERLIARIHDEAVARKFLFVTVDHGWAAIPRRRRVKAENRRVRFMRACGMDERRLADLVRKLAEPTPLEEKYFSRIASAETRWQEMLNEELLTLRMSERLSALLEASPQFKTVWSPRPFSVSMFEVIPPERVPTE